MASWAIVYSGSQTIGHITKQCCKSGARKKNQPSPLLLIALQDPNQGCEVATDSWNDFWIIPLFVEPWNWMEGMNVM